MALAANDSYYHLLGVSEDASFEEIRQSYHEVCRRFHPDKQAAGGKLTPEQLEFWSALQTAWKCLSNEARRMIYDIRRSGKPLSLEDKAKIQKLQRDQAKRDVANMQIQYQQCLDREKQKNGIIVTRALFGDLRPVHEKEISVMERRDKENHEIIDNSQQDDSPTAKEAEFMSADIEKEFGICGPVIDVTVPIQCSVDNHRVILASGIGKSDLPGFYNPTVFHHSSSSECPSSPSAAKGSQPCSLYVLYKFKGVTHEVNVSETDALWLPLRSHAVGNDKPLAGPSPPKVADPPSPVNSVRARAVPPTPMGIDANRHQMLQKSSPGGSVFSSWILAAVSVAGIASIVGFWLFKKSKHN
jgi:curved DNA-binding protein CbpA